MAASTTSRPLLVSLLVAVVVIAVAATIWQVSGDNDGTGQTAHAQQSPKPKKQFRNVVTDPTDPAYDALAVPPVPSAQPAERDNFGLLRAEPDGMPAQSVKVMGKPLYGLNADLAKNITVDVASKYGRFWFAPANELMFIVAHHYATHRVNLKCALTKDALTKGVIGTFIQTGDGGANWGSMTQQLIVGIAPDGVRKARMRIGPETVTLPVVDHLFFYTARSHENPEITYEPAPQTS